jgi:glycosyltransferase involved in cell wall biosynthesis
MLNIAVFLECDLQSGGGFQYELTVAKLLKRHENAKYKYIFFAKEKKTCAYLESIGLDSLLYSESFLQKIHKVLCRSRLIYPLLKTFGLHLSSLDRLLDKNDVDLVYFLSPNYKSPYLSRFNFITTVWDLSHRDFMEFPEVSWHKEFETREELFSQYLKKAVAVIADSPIGKLNLLRRYGLDPGRIYILPFLPSYATHLDNKAINIKQKYGIVSDYVFYPAQFWAHKNHIYILDALRILKDEYDIKISAIFSGTDKGNLAYIKNKTQEFGLSRQVIFSGFVPAEEIGSLYRQALALVMPTYFGPTNIPPLEAFHIGCPVCYSDIEGARDQVQDAAFLIDLNDPMTLVEHLLILQFQPQTVAEKIKKGKELVSAWQEDDFWHQIELIFKAYAIKQRCWKS